MSLISLAPEEVRAPECGSVPNHYTPLPGAGEVVLRITGPRGPKLVTGLALSDLALDNAAGLE